MWLITQYGLLIERTRWGEGWALIGYPSGQDEFSALFRVKRFCLGCFTTNGIALRTSCLFWMNEWRVVDDRTRDLSSYNTFFNMWTVSSGVSMQDIQRHYWQPLSVHLWAYCTHLAHDVNDVMCEGWPQHRGLRSLLFSNSGMGSFTFHKNQISVSAVRRDLRFSSLSEKTRKSNRLQMSLQRQHFLLSYLNTLSFGAAGVRSRTLPLSRPALSQLS